jgi:hypothetical protein
MRIALILAVVALAACAAQKLATTPPTGVDLSGLWKLNEADSDDPQRLMQTQLAVATANASASGPTGSSGRGDRSERGGASPGRFIGPVMPSVAALDEGLRWPDKSVAINQSGGVVTFTSGGRNRVCRPEAASGRSHNASGADNPSQGRGSAPPPVCGWDDRTLVVQSGDPEDDRPPFELCFSVSDDGRRLVEVVRFKGGRSSGFTASRVWDRVSSGSQP